MSLAEGDTRAAVAAPTALSATLSASLHGAVPLALSAALSAALLAAAGALRPVAGTPRRPPARRRFGTEPGLNRRESAGIEAPAPPLPERRRAPARRAPDPPPAAAIPAVSVVIPAYNAARFVDRAIRSALTQTGVRIAEVVVVDDASTDGTAGILRAMARAEPRLVVLSNGRNLGPGATRNRGIGAVTAPWVAVLDADDAMEPGRLARLIGVAEAAGFDAVGDLWTNWDTRVGRPAARQIPASGRIQALGLADMVRLDPETGEHLAAIKPVFRTALCRDGRLRYPEALRLGEDLSMYREMIVAGARFGLVRERLYRFTPRMIDGRLVGTSVTRVDYAALARDTRRFRTALRGTAHWSDALGAMLDEAIRGTERKDRRWGWTMLRAGEWRQLGRWLAADPRKAWSLVRIAAAKAAGHRGVPE